MADPSTALTIVEAARELGIALWASARGIEFRCATGAMPADLRAALARNKHAVLEALAEPQFTPGPEQATLKLPDTHLWRWSQIKAGVLGLAYTNGPHWAAETNCALDLDILESAAREVSSAHAILRARIADLNDGPWLIFDRQVCLERINSDGQTSRSIEERLAATIWRRFDVETNGVVRFFVISGSAGPSIFGVVVHHLVADDFALRLVISDWVRHYDRLRGKSDVAPRKPELQFWDYVNEMRRWQDSQAMVLRIRYWTNLLKGARNSRLPPDFDFDDDVPDCIEEVVVKIDSAFCSKLFALAASLRVSIFDVLHAAKARALGRHLRANDVTIRVLYNGRQDPALLRVVASMESPIILRLDMKNAATFTELARLVHVTWQSAISNCLPYHYVAERFPEIGIDDKFAETNFGGNELLSSGPMHSRQAESLAGCIKSTPEQEWPPSGVTPSLFSAHMLNIDVSPHGAEGHIKFLPSMYKRESIESFRETFLDVLHEGCREIEVPPQA